MRSRPLYTGHHLHSLRTTCKFITSLRRYWFLMSSLYLTMRHHGFDNSSSHFLPELLNMPVSSTLTTNTLNVRSLKRFEASFRQQTSMGQTIISSQAFAIDFAHILMLHSYVPVAHHLIDNAMTPLSTNVLDSLPVTLSPSSSAN